MQDWRDPFIVLTALVTITLIGIGQAAGRWDMAVYALSFWHYPVYALAFMGREIGFEDFKRDAILLKAISIAAFVVVILTSFPNPLACLVMAVGFGLIMSATWVLGKDRTYFGFEIGGLPGERVSGFPFSVVPHPMLSGNVIAYSAMLLDDQLRANWWPLSVLHALLNILMIIMEANAGKNRTSAILYSAIGLVLWAALLLFAYWGAMPFALATVVIILFFGMVIIRRYTKGSASPHLEDHGSA